MELISDSTKLYDRQRLINDFVFLCYFCGNDFLPNIPSLNIKPHNKKIPNGIDTIIETYATEMKKTNNPDTESDTGSETKTITKPNQVIQYLINIKSKTVKSVQTAQTVQTLNDITTSKHISLNQDLFIAILGHLASLETEYYHTMYKSRRFFKSADSNNPIDIDKHNYEENIYYLKDHVQVGNPDLSLDDWKYNYYAEYYDIEINPTLKDDHSLNHVLEEYLRGLVWTTYYYYDKCKDYEWFYEHHHGPFISDLHKYLKDNKQRLEHYEKLYSYKGVWFENQIRPLQQLLMVLPHESSNLIPASYKSLMFSVALRNYFPPNILSMRIDGLHKQRAWQNIPMINIIPARKILKLTSKIILKDEKNRNMLLQEYIKEPSSNSIVSLQIISNTNQTVLRK